MASGSSTTFQLGKTTTIAAIACAMLVVVVAGLSSGAGAAVEPSGSFEDDKVHDFLRVLDRAAAYRRECFGECAKGCYCADNPYSCLRECMPTPPTRRCGATYGTVQDVFSSSATFAATVLGTEDGGAAGATGATGEGFFSSAT